jgi:hypothetical protein
VIIDRSFNGDVEAGEDSPPEYGASKCAEHYHECHRGNGSVRLRIAHKLRGGAATIKKDLFHQKWPPRRASFMRWLGSPAFTVPECLQETYQNQDPESEDDNEVKHMPLSPESPDEPVDTVSVDEEGVVG